GTRYVPARPIVASGVLAFHGQFERRLRFTRAPEVEHQRQDRMSVRGYGQLDLSAAEQAPIARQKARKNVTDDLDELPAISRIEVVLLGDELLDSRIAESNGLAEPREVIPDCEVQ